MRKEIKAIIAVVLAVWFFVMGFELGAYKEKKAQNPIDTVNPVTSTTQPTNPQPTLPSTTEPSTVPEPTDPQPTVPGTDDTTTDNSSTAPTAKDPLSLSKEEIVAEVNKYVNQVKKEQNMTASGTSVVNVSVTDCTAQGFVSTINNIITSITDKFGGEENYTFVNGQATDADGKAVTPWDVIPPTRKDFSAVDAGVASAKVEKVGENTMYTIVMVVEDTSMANPVPTYNSTVIGYLDLVSLDLPITLTKADMHYPGSTISVVVNPDGKVVEIINKLPMEGTGATKFLGKEVFASFGGALDEKWTFTY
ncbi:MAG: hypothetical protein J6V06_05820 [Clostridia bacterium]|nr:hypothetical protein [Clostridia bacterium]MBO7319522.1 hypothetical protein [Clostridia bacterium]